MAIKSTKKVLASILSFAMISQSFCGAKDFIENKNIPQKSIVIKKEKPTVFNKIKEASKKYRSVKQRSVKKQKGLWKFQSPFFLYPLQMKCAFHLQEGGK